MEWGPLIVSILSLVGVLVKIWADKTPEREQEKRDEHIDQGRQDIVDGNVDAVSKRVDDLLRDTAPSDSGGVKNGEDKQGSPGTV